MKCENWKIIQSEKTNFKRFESKHFQSLRDLLDIVFGFYFIRKYLRKAVEIREKCKINLFSIALDDESKSLTHFAFEKVFCDQANSVKVQSRVSTCA